MRRINQAMLIGLMLAWSLPVHAVDIPNGWYAGASAGVSKNLDFCAQTGFATFCDNDEFAWKILGGYQFMKWVGLEVGYVYLGEPTTTTITGNTTTATTTAESQGVAFSVPFTIPGLEKTGFYGKIGGFYWDRENTTETLTSTATSSADGFDPLWGWGFRWPMSSRLSISLDYEQYLDVGDANGISDIEFFSAGILWHF
jgi:hypothetical protein